jgi:hypothetical protein
MLRDEYYAFLDDDDLPLQPGKEPPKTEEGLVEELPENSKFGNLDTLKYFTDCLRKL